MIAQPMLFVDTGVRCPALEGKPCPLAAGAHVIVVTLRRAGQSARALLDAEGAVNAS